MSDTRTTEAAVREIIKTSLSTAQVRAFVKDANVWVTEELGAASLSAARLEIIERWLACAFVRVRDLGLKSSTVEDVSEQYQVDPDVTDYLLRAAALDPTGTVRRTFLVTDGAGGKSPVIAKIGKGFAGDV